MKNGLNLSFGTFCVVCITVWRFPESKSETKKVKSFNQINASSGHRRTPDIPVSSREVKTGRSQKTSCNIVVVEVDRIHRGYQDGATEALNGMSGPSETTVYVVQFCRG